MELNRICVYCGSNRGARPPYEAAAREMGAAMARRGIGLVYGGGRVGLMGTLADAVLAQGGEVTGVIPEAIVAMEVAHTGLSDLRVVGSMHERKALMADLADAFVALPGGYGTFEEFFESLTWAQLGFHRKPCGLLNVEGYYDPLLALLDHAVEERFVSRLHRSMVIEETDPDPLLDLLRDYQAPAFHKWIDREES
jgi:uncharacterized protein (TIGR00730 family)